MSVDSARLRRFVEDLFRRFKDALVKVSHEPYLDSSGGEFGSPQYGPAAELDALVMHKHVWVRTEALTERLSRTQIYVRADVKVRDRITLPDGSRPSILSVEGILDDEGKPYYTEVFF